MIQKKNKKNNYGKEKKKNNKFTYKESFNFIPQIDIKFNKVKEITKELINDLKLKLNMLFKEKNIKIIKIQKGSLDIAIALNYLIQEGLSNLNIKGITIDELLEKLNKFLNIETKKVKNMIKNNLLIGQQDKTFKPDFVNENLLDLTTEESKEVQ